MSDGREIIREEAARQKHCWRDLTQPCLGSQCMAWSFSYTPEYDMEAYEKADAERRGTGWSALFSSPLMPLPPPPIKQWNKTEYGYCALKRDVRP